MLTALAFRHADPTRTLTLRTQYARAVRRRFVAVRRAVRASIADQDAFGLQARQLGFQAAPPRAWALPTIDAQVTAFLAWLASQWDDEVLEATQREAGTVTQRRRWQDRYVTAAYLQGVLSAQRQLRQAGVALGDAAFPGEVFFGDLLTIPMHREAVDLLQTHAFADLQAITEATTQALRRDAVTGLLQQKVPAVLAQRLTAPVTRIGVRRGETLARTGVISAVAQGTLTELQRQGVTQVRAQVEWVFTTAGDAKVCPRCSALAGRTFTMTEAQGLIPQHGNCRCAWRIQTGAVAA